MGLVVVVGVIEEAMEESHYQLVRTMMKVDKSKFSVVYLSSPFLCASSNGQKSSKEKEKNRR